MASLKSQAGLASKGLNFLSLRADEHDKMVVQGRAEGVCYWRRPMLRFPEYA
jgi:hypothetical protein